MIRRWVSVGLALAVVGSVLGSSPASAGAPGRVPARVQIEDPAGDANSLNSYRGVLPIGGDHSTPVDLTVPDMLAVWFTHDAKTISANIHTEAPPPAQEASYLFVVTANPGGNCVDFGATVEGPTSDERPYAYLWSCSREKSIPARLRVREAADGTGIITITVARSADPGFAHGEVLESPSAFNQEYTYELGPLGHAHLTIIDDTRAGRDYVVR